MERQEQQNFLDTEPSRFERIAATVLRPIVRVFELSESQDLELSPAVVECSSTTAREEGLNAFFNIGVSGFASNTYKRKK